MNAPVRRGTLLPHHLPPMRIRFRTPLRPLLAALLLVAGLPASAVAQGVLVAPHGIFIDARTRSGAIELYNPGDVAAEVSVSAFFGYPTTDATGQIVLAAPPAEGADTISASAAKWVRILPDRVVLQPRERQTLRVLMRPPVGLPDGEYWSRIVVDAREVPPAPATASDGAISVGLSMRVRTIIALFYRQGSVGSAVTLGAVTARHAGDSLQVELPLERTGNAAYLGTVRLQLRNAAGSVVRSTETTVGVYYTMRPRLALDVAGVPAGEYRLEVEVGSQRPDLPREVVLPSAVARQSVNVTL